MVSALTPRTDNAPRLSARPGSPLFPHNGTLECGEPFACQPRPAVPDAVAFAWFSHAPGT